MIGTLKSDQIPWLGRLKPMVLPDHWLGKVPSKYFCDCPILAI